MSCLILCDNGGRFEGERALGESGVVSLQLERLKQPAGTGHRLEQPAAGNHFEEEEEMMQPRKLCEAQSADSFCAALRKPFWKHV